MDDGRIGDEMTLTAIAKRLDDISARLGSVQSDTTSLTGQFATLSGQVKSLDGKLTALDHKMTIEFEATRGLINLGFENVQMLREEVGRRFDDTDRAHADHKTVLEAAVVGLRRDVQRRRRPGRRR